MNSADAALLFHSTADWPDGVRYLTLASGTVVNVTWLGEIPLSSSATLTALNRWSTLIAADAVDRTLSRRTGLASVPELIALVSAEEISCC